MISQLIFRHYVKYAVFQSGVLMTPPPPPTRHPRGCLFSTDSLFKPDPGRKNGHRPRAKALSFQDLSTKPTICSIYKGGFICIRISVIIYIYIYNLEEGPPKGFAGKASILESFFSILVAWKAQDRTKFGPCSVNLSLLCPSCTDLNSLGMLLGAKSWFRGAVTSATASILELLGHQNRAKWAFQNHFALKSGDVLNTLLLAIRKPLRLALNCP